MLNSKIDLFGQGWIDTVFEGRNKEYGAYDLRSRESRTTVKAAIIGAAIFATLISLPLILKQFEGIVRKHKEVLDEKITMVDLEMLTPPEKTEVEKFIPPPPPKEMKSIKEVKKFTPPVVAPEEEVVEELVKQEELKTADAGARNIDASEDGDIVIDETPVEHLTEQVITEDNGIHEFSAVEVAPEYPGGLQKFREYIMQNINIMDLDLEQKEVRIMLRFVVEKDGYLTDIRVLRDGGIPNMASRAARVLARCPKWKPGVLNGKSVRVAYTIPIVIRLQE